MRKFIIYATPIVLLALFICIMLSGSFLKKPLGKEDSIPKIIKEIIGDVNNGDWETVNTKVDKFDKTWKKIVTRVQFSSERDEMNFVSVNIARLRGAVQAKDKVNALIELNEALIHWKELGE